MEEKLNSLDDKLNRIEEKLIHIETISKKVDEISSDVNEITSDVDDMSKDMDEISKDIDEQAKHVSMASRMMARPLSLGYEKTKTVIFGVLALTVALGQYSEAVALIGDGINAVRSSFTHDIEYEMLGNVHVGNTQAYIENLAGTPQVSRVIADGLVANYFYNEKFLLTVFFKDERVTAYSLLPLVEDFEPKLGSTGNNELALGRFTYAQFPANATQYMVDHSKTVSYYLENLESGRAGLFVNQYLGNLVYGKGEHSDLVGTFYDQEVRGDEEKQMATQQRIRTEMTPNFYGEGEIGVEFIEKSLLTEAEFRSYFGAQ
ncbi:MAG: hypothetical protein H6999_07985 [Hahellaceae bacterium]|nr:hypothetical protein [Hahellaceae bacterium]MCP5169682.1 hypothetical protein [Hahellaceae bacterium]